MAEDTKKYTIRNIEPEDYRQIGINAATVIPKKSINSWLLEAIKEKLEKETVKKSSQKSD